MSQKRMSPKQSDLYQPDGSKEPSAVRHFNRRGIISSFIGAPMLLLPRRGRSAKQTRITLLHTNDTHSRMEPFAKGKFKGRAGVAKRASLVNAIRKANPNTLLLDAGDTFQGTPYFNQFLGKLDIQMMAALGYDAVTLGNHDFDAGVQQLAQNLQYRERTQFISSNFTIGESCPISGLVQRHTMFTLGEVRVGIFGLGIAFHGLVNPKLHQGVSYQDPREAAQREVSALREKGCDLIVALSHLGYKGYRGEVGDLDWPKHVPGVHYVVGGHTHTFLRHPTVVSHPSGWETLVMQVGHSGLNLGHAELLVDSRGQVDARAVSPLGVGGSALA